MEDRVCPSDIDKLSTFLLLWDYWTEKLDPEDFYQEAAFIYVGTGSVDLYPNTEP